jgi:hypothetical protein
VSEPVDPWANTREDAPPADPRQADATTSGVLVWDNQAGAPTYIRVEDYDAAIASQRYRPYASSVVRTNRMGATIDSTPAAGQAHLDSGERFQSGAAAATARHEGEVDAAFDNAGDKAFSFVEGVADVISLGALHERGPVGDRRRKVNSTSAFLGQVAGLATSLLNPASAAGNIAKILPSTKVARAGESGGRAVAQALFGVGTKGERAAVSVARRATEEAISNAAVGGAMAMGHATSDAIIEDKPFAAEHIASTIWQDAAVGGGFGAAGALLGKARSTIRAREAIAAQGGVLDAASPASQGIHSATNDAVASWDNALERHRVKIGVLDVAAEAGELGERGSAWVAGRREALKAAERAAERLKKHDLAAVLAGDDARAVNHALSALDDYGSAMAHLDEAIGPGPRTVHGMRPRLDIVQDGVTPHSGGPLTKEWDPDSGASPLAIDTDEVMWKGLPARKGEMLKGGSKRVPEYREAVGPADLERRYEEIYGRPFRALDQLADDAADARRMADGNVETPSSLETTNVLKRKKNVETPSSLETTNPGKILDDGRPRVGDTIEYVADGFQPKRGQFEVRRIQRDPMTGEDVPVVWDPHANGGKGAEWPAPEFLVNGRIVKRSGPANPGKRQGAGSEEIEATSPSGRPDMPVPDLMGPHPKSPLAAFAYDVESAAAKLGSGKLEDVLSSLGRKGRAPYSLERFRELVGEAEQAGYLMTKGPGVEVPYLGASVGDELVVRGEASPGHKPDKKVRFGGWADQGNRQLEPKTIVDGADPLANQLNAGAVDPLAGKTYKDAHPAGKAERGRKGKGPADDDTYVDGPPSFDEPAPRVADPMDGATAVDTDPRVEVRHGAGGNVRPGSAMDNFIEQMNAPGPRYDAGEVSARKVREALDEMNVLTDGRVGSSQAREAAEAAGLALGARGPLADHLGAIWGLRQLARASADATKGAKHSPLMQKIIKRAGIAAGRQAVMGGNIMQSMGGAAGGVVGGHLVGLAFGAAGGIATSVGRARDMVIKAGAALLAGRGSRMAASIPIAARYSYDGSEPTDDVAERVQQLHTVMSDPESARSQIREDLKGLSAMAPDVAEAAVENRIRQYQNLALQAPVFVWSALGEARPAGQQALRRFREYEDATWDFDGLIRDVAAGNLSRTRAQALREQYPQAQAILAQQLLSGREHLGRMSREHLATIEMITGMVLSNRTPAYAARQSMTFTPPVPPAPTPGAGAMKPPAPTPAQAMIAPGN